MDDPRCPDCDGPIGPTATYCMHCGAEFPERRGATRRVGADDAATEGGSTGGNSTDGDSTLDGALRLAIGASGGAVVGVLVAVVALLATGDVLTVLLGPVAWAGAAVHVARRPSARAAFGRACALVAIAILLVPTVVFGEAVTPQSDGEASGLVGHLVLFVLGEFAAGIVAASVGLVGYGVARKTTYEGR